MLRDVVVVDFCRHRRRRAHAPAIHALSHVDHKKRVAWFSISMHACGSVPILMVLHLVVLRVHGAPLQTLFSYARKIFDVYYQNN